MADKSERKERVMHTRIPESLDIQLRDKAKGLGVSVSNLVRNALANTIDLVDDIVSDSVDIARTATKEAADILADAELKVQEAEIPAPKPSTEQHPMVLGWQRLVLNLEAICSSCNVTLPKGVEAAYGIVASPGTDTGIPPFICTKCLEELSHEPTINR
ncbi:MAG: hypothetical protein COA99_16340 [Moraxellaceae bacterium]|nr:MAG: hypothetical protein COA99_16340 [Moraxellaceae bacterium]